MLKKLMKYEWKNISKVGGLLLLAMMVVTLMGIMYMATPTFREIFLEDAEVSVFGFTVMMITGVAGLLAYVLLLIGAAYGIIIFVGSRFFKTMFGDEGYLTMTLPVKSTELLLSKIFVSGVWSILITLGILLSVGLLVIGGPAILGYQTNGLDMLRDIWNLLKEIYFESFGNNLILYVAFMICSAIIGPFMSISTLFGALTLGQFAKKHKALLGVGIYFGLTFLESIVNNTMNVIIGSTSFVAGGTMSTSMVKVSVSSLIISIVMGVVMFFVANYVINNKLNIE